MLDIEMIPFTLLDMEDQLLYKEEGFAAFIYLKSSKREDFFYLSLREDFDDPEILSLIINHEVLHHILKRLSSAETSIKLDDFRKAYPDWRRFI